ncbi:MAG: AAC(3) family N-acetyltransferase [Acidimicrobiales bacterium]
MPRESDVIAGSSKPVTRTSILRDLRALGVVAGDTLIVHSSLSSLGWVVGGAQTVVEALLDATTATGTVVVPTQSAGSSDPAGWSNPPVPAEWFDEIRAAMPVFDPDLTPTSGMGRIVDCFRGHRSTRRSDHPLVSFAANGAAAAAITEHHPLSPSLGDDSPLGRLYERNAKVLLLGVSHASNTSLHLAEYRADWSGKTTERQGVPRIVDGARVWLEFEDLALDETDFDEIGDAFAATGGETRGRVGQAEARLSSQRALVDFATEWMTRNR